MDETREASRRRWQRALGIGAIGSMAAAGLWTLQLFIHPIGWAATSGCCCPLSARCW